MQSIINDIKNQFTYGNMIIRLILVIVFVFVFEKLLGVLFFFAGAPQTHENILEWFMVTASLQKLIWKPWSVVSYMFLHSGLWHLAFNMLTFYIFGNIVYDFLGNKKILPIFIMGGIAGALLCTVMFNLIPALHKFLEVPMLGASAGVMAIMLAAATLAPDREINLMFLGPVKIKYIAMFFILFDLITIPKENPGGHIAHLGGAVFGYFFIRRLQNGTDYSLHFNRFTDNVRHFIGGLLKQKPMMRAERSQTTYTKTTYTGAYTANAAGAASGKPGSATPPSEQEKLDAILDKIAQSGYDRLSKEEMDFLHNWGKK
ncbi:MAG TPA: rhomboid family intramembrane serine protease [Chitinophagales bacterium]|nr:rhomboid family intramembrane serine protease [Chitinophagales bacterium]